MKQFEFKKSSFSGYNDCHCVEVASDGASVSVRHSTEDQGMIQYTPDEWSAFIKGVKAGEFDL